MRAVVCCMVSGCWPSLGKTAHVSAGTSTSARPSPAERAMVGTPMRCVSSPASSWKLVSEFQEAFTTRRGSVSIRRFISARCSPVMSRASSAIAGFSPSKCIGTRAMTPARRKASFSTIRYSMRWPPFAPLGNCTQRRSVALDGSLRTSSDATRQKLLSPG